MWYDVWRCCKHSCDDAGSSLAWKTWKCPGVWELFGKSQGMSGKTYAIQCYQQGNMSLRIWSYYSKLTPRCKLLRESKILTITAWISVIVMLQTVCQVRKWKNSENRSVFSENMDKSLVPRFFIHDTCRFVN